MAPIGDQEVNEESGLIFTATASDVDNPQEDLTFSLDPGAPDGSSITSDGHFSWIPGEAQGPGIFSVTIRVTDNGTPPRDDYETINITVNEVNMAPIIDPIDDQVIDEGSQLEFTVSAADEDLPSNDLIFSLDPGFPPGASITPEGVFTWSPEEAQGPGNYEITVRVTDDGIPPLSDFDSFIVHVNEINQTPTALDDFYIAFENTPLEISPPGVLLNDMDEDLPPNPLTAALVDSPVHGLLNLNQDGSFVYSPEADFIGSDNFTYFVNDGIGNSNIATVTIQIFVSRYQNYLPLVNKD
jgi:hypothetical protein